MRAKCVLFHEILLRKNVSCKYFRSIFGAKGAKNGPVSEVQVRPKVPKMGPKCLLQLREKFCIFAILQILRRKIFAKKWGDVAHSRVFTKFLLARATSFLPPSHIFSHPHPSHPLSLPHFSNFYIYIIYINWFWAATEQSGFAKIQILEPLTLFGQKSTFPSQKVDFLTQKESEALKSTRFWRQKSAIFATFFAKVGRFSQFWPKSWSDFGVKNHFFLKLRASFRENFWPSFRKAKRGASLGSNAILTLTRQRFGAGKNSFMSLFYLQKFFEAKNGAFWLDMAFAQLFPRKMPFLASKNFCK